MALIIFDTAKVFSMEAVFPKINICVRDLEISFREIGQKYHEKNTKNNETFA